MGDDATHSAGPYRSATLDAPKRPRNLRPLVLGCLAGGIFAGFAMSFFAIRARRTRSAVMAMQRGRESVHAADARVVRFPRLRRLDLRCQPVDLGDVIEVTWESHHGDRLHVARSGCIEGNLSAQEPVQDGCADAASLRAFVAAVRRIAPPPPEASEPSYSPGFHPAYEFVRWTTTHGTYTWQIPDYFDGRWEQQIRQVDQGIDAARRRLLTVNTPHAVYARRQIEAQPSVASASMRWSSRTDIGGGGGMHFGSQHTWTLRADGVFLSSSRGTNEVGEEIAARVDPDSARGFVEFLHARGWADAAIWDYTDSSGHSPPNAQDISTLWNNTMPIERCGRHP